MSAIDEVKTRLDIVDVIGAYVPLKKAGRYFKAPCPFHTEKTPSFIVYPERQSWHCFGACGTGGDVLSFVARKESLDFNATLRLLAERAGVELRNDGPRREEIKTLHDVNEAAALFYHSLLQNAGPARAYAESRGLDNGAIADFQLGYAPAGWDTLRNHLAGRGFDEAQQIEAGLLVESDRGGYDRFRDRLIFPIRDERGRVVGCGGRVLPDSKPMPDGQPPAKYMNTPQTPIFDKGSVFYALDRAKDEIRRGGTAVIVEGYMDVIAAHQHGFRNVVASMGTALTDKQAQLLQRFAQGVVLAMDADEAGSAAALRGVQVVAASTAPSSRPQPGRGDGRAPSRPLDIRVLALPPGKDPDDLIRDEAPAWQAAVNAALPVVEHLFVVVSAGLDLAQPLDRSRLAAELLPTIGEISDPVIKAHYLQKLSRLARVNEEALRQQLPRRPRAPRPRGDASAASSPTDTAPTIAAKLKKPGEEFCLALLYREPALRRHGEGLSEALFSLSENQELFRRWRLEEQIREDEVDLWEHLQALMETRLPRSETSALEMAFLDCVRRLEGVRIKAVKEASALVLAEGEAGLRPGQVASIARTRMETGSEEAEEDDPASAAASQLLDDMEAGLNFHRRLIEGSRSVQPGGRSTE